MFGEDAFSPLAVLAVDTVYVISRLYGFFSFETLIADIYSDKYPLPVIKGRVLTLTARGSTLDVS